MKSGMMKKTPAESGDRWLWAMGLLVHNVWPDIHYYLYLMEWPEEATDELLQNLKLHTAQLFDAYDKAEDRIAFLHDQIRAQLQQAQPLPYDKLWFLQLLWVNDNDETPKFPTDPRF